MSTKAVSVASVGARASVMALLFTMSCSSPLVRDTGGGTGATGGPWPTWRRHRTKLRLAASRSGRRDSRRRTVRESPVPADHLSLRELRPGGLPGRAEDHPAWTRLRSGGACAALQRGRLCPERPARPDPHRPHLRPVRHADLGQAGDVGARVTPAGSSCWTTSRSAPTSRSSSRWASGAARSRSRGPRPARRPCSTIPTWCGCRAPRTRGTSPDRPHHRRSRHHGVPAPQDGRRRQRVHA